MHGSEQEVTCPRMHGLLLAEPGLRQKCNKHAAETLENRKFTVFYTGLKNVPYFISYWRIRKEE